MLVTGPPVISITGPGAEPQKKRFNQVNRFGVAARSQISCGSSMIPLWTHVDRWTWQLQEELNQFRDSPC